MLYIVSLLILLQYVPCLALEPRISSYACNNSPDLCDRSYANVTHLGAHDSPFLRDRSTNDSVSGNQDIDTTRQLDAGVRLLTAQVHNNNGAWHLCHTSCSLLDAGLLSSWLGEIRDWLGRNPKDVVTILLANPDNAAASDLDAHYKAAAVKPYAYAPSTTTTLPGSWPTLGALITSGQRLVTFIADMYPSATAPYLLNEFTYIFENPFNVVSLSNFSCTPERPPLVQGQTAAAVQSGRLPLMNHFLDINMDFGIQVPDIGNTSITNAVSGPTGNLGDAAAACTVAYGKAPTFILVDFFQHGSAIDTVDRINGITPVGRASAPSPSVQTTNSSGAVTYTSTSGSPSINFNGLMIVLLVASLTWRSR